MHRIIHHIPWRRAALATLHFTLHGTGTGRALYLCGSHLKACTANIKATTAEIGPAAAPQAAE